MLKVARRWHVVAGIVIVVAAGSLVVEAQTRKIMIFGGKDHKTYLGCLSCTSSARDSIFNKSGEYGRCSGPFSNSLFCRGPLKDFGRSGPFQDLSACGLNASNPPVLVDEEGAYYGRFSIGGPFGHSDSVCDTFSRYRDVDKCEGVKLVCKP